MQTQKRKINTIGINYLDVGPREAPALLFIHGFPFNLKMWADQVLAWKENFRIVAYDVRGHGDSDPGTEDFSLDLFAADLIGLMDELKIEQAIVCGLSMGGYIALNALEKYPNRFAGLILCDTQCLADSPESKEKRLKAIESIQANGLTLYAKASIINLFAEESFRTKPDVVSNIQKTIEQTSATAICKTLLALSQRKETCSRLHEITIPTLILVGVEDKITPLPIAKRMHEKIKDSTLAIITHSGHLTNLENPTEFNDHVTRFIHLFL